MRRKRRRLAAKIGAAFVIVGSVLAGISDAFGVIHQIDSSYCTARSALHVPCHHPKIVGNFTLKSVQGEWNYPYADIRDDEAGGEKVSLCYSLELLRHTTQAHAGAWPATYPGLKLVLGVISLRDSSSVSEVPYHVEVRPSVPGQRSFVACSGSVTPSTPDSEVSLWVPMLTQWSSYCVITRFNYSNGADASPGQLRLGWPLPGKRHAAHCSASSWPDLIHVHDFSKAP